MSYWGPTRVRDWGNMKVKSSNAMPSSGIRSNPRVKFGSLPIPGHEVPKDAADAPTDSPVVRQGVSSRRPRRVVLGTLALVVAAFVSLLCCALVLATMVAPWFGFWPALLLTVSWGAVPAIALAFCFGAPLGILLQPVCNQWLHIAAFMGLGAVLGTVFALVTAGPAPRSDYLITFAVTASLTGGGALAIGRLAVWRLVRLDPDAQPSALGS